MVLFGTSHAVVFLSDCVSVLKRFAFDTVRHYKLMEKYAMLAIPDNIYNWLVAYFSRHSHCTTYRGQMSDPIQISASIIQGSAIGPASYDVTASDLVAAVTPRNILCKYADDTSSSQRRMLTPEPQNYSM